MKKIGVFDTSLATANIGDEIIMRSFYNEMSYILNENYCMKISTHTPVCHFYQNIKLNPMIRYLCECDYKFIGGSNLILKNMLTPLAQWNINIFNIKGYEDSVLVGCGLNPNSKRVNLYTKLLYKKIFSKNYVHSVRDEASKIFLEDLGFKAVNTGCPTLWSITDEISNKIPQKKSKRVIFTITDYCRDKEKDQKLINILKRTYKELYFFPQGTNDLEYFNEFENIEDICILNPNLMSFEKKLNEGNIDYVGTRLHAGIFSLQHSIRSIIIVVDNRARDMQKSNNLVCVERSNIDELEQIINSQIKTKIIVNRKNIEEFKKQFISM